MNNGVAVCSCQPGLIGSPPACRPECVVSAECPLTQACLNNKCVDPCPGTCGVNANCQVVNHNPICSCTPGNTGDPFTRCYPIPSKLKVVKHFSDFEFLLLFLKNLGVNIGFFFSIATSGKSLRSIAVRSELSLSSTRRDSGVFVSRKLHRRTAELPSGMYNKPRM